MLSDRDISRLATSHPVDVEQNDVISMDRMFGQARSGGGARGRALGSKRRAALSPIAGELRAWRVASSGAAVTSAGNAAGVESTTNASHSVRCDECSDATEARRCVLLSLSLRVQTVGSEPSCSA